MFYFTIVFQNIIYVYSLHKCYEFVAILPRRSYCFNHSFCREIPYVLPIVQTHYHRRTCKYPINNCMNIPIIMAFI